MTLLQAIAPVRTLDSVLLRWFSARAGANTLEESYDRASPFRGKKSRLRVDCCKTSAPPARDARLSHRRLPWSLSRIARERYARPNAAGWQSRRSARKTAPPAFRRAREKHRWF